MNRKPLLKNTLICFGLILTTCSKCLYRSETSDENNETKTGVAKPYSSKFTQGSGVNGDPSMQAHSISSTQQLIKEKIEANKKKLDEKQKKLKAMERESDENQRQIKANETRIKEIGIENKRMAIEAQNKNTWKQMSHIIQLNNQRYESRLKEEEEEREREANKRKIEMGKAKSEEYEKQREEERKRGRYRCQKRQSKS